MQNLHSLIRRWDTETRNTSEAFDRSSELVAQGRITAATPPEQAIAHGLRAMVHGIDMFETGAGIVLDRVADAMLGRPALRLATACLVGAYENTGMPVAKRAMAIVAGLLDDPKLSQAIRPARRVDAETLMVHCLGPRHPRGRSAMAMSLLQVLADENARPNIPAVLKYRALDYVGYAAESNHMPHITERVAEARGVLRLRNCIPDSLQKGSGLFMVFMVNRRF